MKVQFLLGCPKCGQKMLFEPVDNILKGKRKRCVYCGKSFLAEKNILETKKII